jgi:hypothetical protein
VAESSPVIDITSFNGVESLFRHGVHDPWGFKLAGRLADFFIYSDIARFTMPVYGPTPSIDDQVLPPILMQLRARDSDVFSPEFFQVEEKRTLSPEHLADAFYAFAGWAQNSRSAFHQWLVLHAEPWIRDGHLARVRPRYVFDIDRLQQEALFKKVVKSVGASDQDILYGFDVALRYPLYGELVGDRAYFLAHPIRELQRLPTMSFNKGPAPHVALSLADSVTAMARSMTLDEYTSFLHEARGLLRERNVDKLPPGALDREAVREIATRLGLPARLSSVGKVFGITAGVMGIAGAVATVAPAAAAAGGVISVASALWTGTVGRLPSRVSWLRWALEWDLEVQASDA